MATAVSALKSSAPGKAYEVLVVDDSAVIRGMIRRWLETAPSINVVGSAANGQIAITEAKKLNPDVILLDIEMPVMDGLTALPLLKAALPQTHVVMASTLTTRNADISLRAMRLGASDYIPKPESRADLSSGDDFKNAIIAKVIALGAAKRRRMGEALPSNTGTPQEVTARASGTVQPLPSRAPGRMSTSPAVAAQMPLRQPAQPPLVLAIGSSTGGPQALFKVFETLPPEFNLPILITQHMPSTFTSILASHLGKVCARVCKEAEHRDALKDSHVYVAPGGKHMLVTGTPGNAQIKLSQSPEENFCRPAVDPMYRSVASVYGARALAVVLTGMGSDGCNGAKVLRDAGAQIFVQDEASSTVWGMPGSVSKAGLADKEFPLDRMADAIMRTIRK